ncbi:PapG chaperone-binding domain-containing protein [Escherichia coli]|nr:PapG chaperone-binding domain-containing protein [Escherichia coli]
MKNILCFLSCLFYIGAANAGYIQLAWKINQSWSKDVVVDVPWSGKETVIELPYIDTLNATLAGRTCSQQYPIGSAFPKRKAGIWVKTPLNNVVVAGEIVKVQLIVGSEWKQTHVPGWLINTYRDESGQYEGDCVSWTSDSTSLYGRYSIPKIKLTIPRNLTAGRHELIIPVTMGIEEQLGDTIEAFDSNLLGYFGVHNVSVQLNVLNSCTVNASEYRIEHGNMTPSVAENNEKDINVKVRCTSPANVRLSLKTLNPPSMNRPGEGVGVKLSEGWDTYLTINHNASGSIKSFINLQEDFKIKSKIKKSRKSPLAGELRGVALLLIEPL